MPRIAGLLALSDFPLWRQTVDQLCELCDDIYVRFDTNAGDIDIYRAVRDACGDKLRHIMCIDGWHPPEWREELLRLVDSAEDKPDIIVFIDQDELIADLPAFRAELDEFWHSDKDGMMMGYEPLVTRDGETVNDGAPYPPEPHMKAYKWREGLSYWPWHYHGIVGPYVNPACHWKARASILHYCCYTKGLRDLKQWRSDRPNVKQEKRVTILGFGPSSTERMEVMGEVWSLNNCYEVPQLKPLVRHITRIYEMHKMDLRRPELAKDNKPHFWHLDQLGRRGHRIILQKAHPRITNSETYPLEEVIHKLGLDFWTGTGAYMVAQAIAEGYTHIRVYGFDQVDYEHILQRNSFIAWLSYAAGKGIEISGHISWLRLFGMRNGKPHRYGYDYGPMWDDHMNKLLWTGFPFEIKMKVPNQAIRGDLHGHES